MGTIGLNSMISVSYFIVGSYFAHVSFRTMRLIHHMLSSSRHPFSTAVDGALVNALLRLGIVDAQKAAESIRGLMWTRASRTDRGVHALGNVVTVKVRMNDPPSASFVSQFLARNSLFSLGFVVLFLDTSVYSCAWVS